MVLFRNYKPADESIEVVECKVWEAGRATSATPQFFAGMRIGLQDYVDGGMGCNNPTRLLLKEVESEQEADSEENVISNVGCVVSVGTGHPDVIAFQQPPKRTLGSFTGFSSPGIITDDLIKVMHDMSVDCETIHEAMIPKFKRARRLDAYFRFNVEQGMQPIGLAEGEKLADVEAQTKAYLSKGVPKGKVEKLAQLMVTLKAEREDGNPSFL